MNHVAVVIFSIIEVDFHFAFVSKKMIYSKKRCAFLNFLMILFKNTPIKMKTINKNKVNENMNQHKL